MHLLKKLLFKPYLIFFTGLVVWYLYYLSDKSVPDILKTLFVCTVYIFFFWKIFPYLEHSLLKVVNKFPFAHNIPNHVLSGYCFIFTMFFPQFALPIALISKLFIKENTYHSSFTDDHGNEVTRIDSLTPTLFYTRKNGQEDEHIVVTKLKKKPTKVTYE
jgi:hypothetical protein